MGEGEEAIRAITDLYCSLNVLEKEGQKVLLTFKMLFDLLLPRVYRWVEVDSEKNDVFDVIYHTKLNSSGGFDSSSGS